jgi:hypothetical protein
MVRLLADGSGRDIIGAAVVAAFAIAGKQCNPGSSGCGSPPCLC